MANVLLTHSYHLPYDVKQSKKMQPYLPLGTLYAATALRERGISVRVFDTMLTDPEVHFEKKLRTCGARILAVYEDDFNFLTKMCLTRMREVACYMGKVAKAAGLVTIVHGSDSTDHPELFLQSGFDYVLCGEAEDLLGDVCDAILHEAPVPSRDGLMQLDETGELFCSGQKLARNVGWSKLAAPARDLVSVAPYIDAWQRMHGHVSMNIVASRGCPFHCNWCAKPISGNRFQLRDAAAVAEEMAELKAQGAEHLWFSDDIFALNHHWMREFADEVKRFDAAVPYKVQSRADLMRDDTVASLKASGCKEVWMGVESGSQAILDAMDKGITLSQITVARQRLRDAGIRACFFLQFGYPGETWSDLQKTIEIVRTQRPDDIGISFSYPLPGTLFYEKVRSQLGGKRNWTDSNDLCIMFKAAYTTEFYRAVREALHAEVASWSAFDGRQLTTLESLWRNVEELERVSHVADAFTFPREIAASYPPLVKHIASATQVDQVST